MRQLAPNSAERPSGVSARCFLLATSTALALKASAAVGVQGGNPPARFFRLFLGEYQEIGIKINRILCSFFGEHQRIDKKNKHKLTSRQQTKTKQKRIPALAKTRLYYPTRISRLRREEVLRDVHA